MCDGGWQTMQKIITDNQDEDICIDSTFHLVLN